VRIERALLDRIVAHARRDFPNECCGMIATREGRAVAIHEATNVAASPLRFEVEGREIIRAQDAFEADGAEMAAIYHSHTRSEPYPSETDKNFARGWPGVEWLIVGVPRDGGDPTVRSYLIDDGVIEEIEVQVDG
jgi:proteasome lid subunit RPN8/RPN11